MSSLRSSLKIVSAPDLRRLLTIASRHKVGLAGAAAAFLLAPPLLVMASLWMKTGLFPNRLGLLEPALRAPSSGLSLVTVSAVGAMGGWEYEVTVRDTLRLIVPAIMFGLYLSVLVATLRAWRTRRRLRTRRDVKSQAGVAGGLLALIGNFLAAGISLMPPCIGVITTVSILALLGFGAGVVILPYLSLFGSLIMLVSLVFLVRRVEPDAVQEDSR